MNISSTSAMNIAGKNIKFGNGTEQKKKVQPDSTITGVPLPGSKRLNYSPVTIGIMNGFCWFGVGMVLDKLSSKIFKTKLSTKFSILLQAGLGTFMGINAYKFAKKEAKQA